MHKIILATAAILLVSPAAHATSVTLDFSGAACEDGLCNTTSEAISQGYGDIAGVVDVVYDAITSSDGNQNWNYWGVGYEELVGVAYGLSDTVGGTLSIIPETGYEVSLMGLDLAPYLDRTVTSGLSVMEIGGATVDLGTMVMSTLSSTSYDLSAFGPSTDGYVLGIGPSFFNTGVDNILFDVSKVGTNPNPTPIPLPASAVFLLAGLAGLGGVARRRAAR